MRRSRSRKFILKVVFVGVLHLPGLTGPPWYRPRDRADVVPARLGGFAVVIWISIHYLKINRYRLFLDKRLVTGEKFLKWSIKEKKINNPKEVNKARKKSTKGYIFLKHIRTDIHVVRFGILFMTIKLSYSEGYYRGYLRYNQDCWPSQTTHGGCRTTKARRSSSQASLEMEKIHKCYWIREMVFFTFKVKLKRNGDIKIHDSMYEP